ncbi:MAG TPA: hypothetical protein VNI78_05265 [Vicinamibacterales bacterium]|nr:hypothetical protein [Vicinamibacterales bacterium]
MQVRLTVGERQHLKAIIQRVAEVRDFVCQGEPADEDAGTWFLYLSAMKVIQGNANNDLSFLASLLAKRHLVRLHGEIAFDAATKPQGAPGLDIDVRDKDGRRIIGEVKTTSPYKGDDFGGQQWTTIRSDIAKLHTTDADFKYFFVTDERAEEILRRCCSTDLAGINLVRLEP